MGYGREGCINRLSRANHEKDLIDQPISEVTEQLAADFDLGLSGKEVSKRLARQEPTEFRKTKGISLLVLFVSQFKSLVI
jgi:Ca2+-transporting ATPase